MHDVKRKIYVVDDDLAVRFSLETMLRSVGYDVELFDDGATFLKTAESGLFGCVVLDVRLPGRRQSQLSCRRKSSCGEPARLMLTRALSPWEWGWG